MATTYHARVEARVRTETSARIDQVWRQMQARAEPGVHVARGSAIRAILLRGLDALEATIDADGS